MIGLHDRVVLATGAAGGIGSASARTVVDWGGRVVVHDLDRAAVQGLAARLGDRAMALSSDLGDPQAVATVWSDACGAFGGVDVLVNNAGLLTDLSLDYSLNTWVSDWNRVLAVNLVAPSILCREAVLSYSVRPGGGIIVNVVSVTAFRGAREPNWHYGASKGGLVALTRTIARHYGRQGVTAGVAPGVVETPMIKPGLDRPEERELFESQTALGRITQPQDVANVIAFLATGLAEHATGSIVDVNSASYLR